MIIVRNKLLIIFSVVFLLCFSIAKAESHKLTQEQIQQLANQATELFQQASEMSQTQPNKGRELYGQAILRWQKIIDQGQLRNSGLYYNIGNAYLMQKDIGHAILNYRRSLKYGKATTELMGNLHAARSMRFDNIPEKAQRKILHTLFFWHYDFSARVKYYIALSSWVLFWLLASLALKAKRKSKIAIIATCLISISFGISTYLDHYNSTNNVYGVIVADTADARQGDGNNYPESFSQPLHSGTEFKLLETRVDWVHVELVSGDKTWLKANAVKTIGYLYP